MLARMMQHNVTNDPTGTPGVSVAEAARALGISSEAVRMRLRRRSLEGYRDGGGRWRVRLEVPTEQTTEPDSTIDRTATPGDTSAVVVAASREALERDKADLQAERDRLLAMVEATLAERRDQPPTVLTSLRRLVATLTDWAVARLGRGGQGDTAA